MSDHAHPVRDVPIRAAALATALAYGVTLPGLPEAVSQAGLGPAGTGQLMAVYGAAVVIAAPLCGRACRRWPITRIVQIGLLGQVLALALHALPPGMLTLTVARAVLGIFAAAVLVGLPMQVTGPECEGSLREHRLSRISRAAIIGGLFGPAVGGLASTGPSLANAAAAGAAVLITAGVFYARTPHALPVKACVPAPSVHTRHRLLIALAALAAAAMALYEVGVATHGPAMFDLTTRALGAMFAGCGIVMLLVQMSVFRRGHDPLTAFAWAAPAFLAMALALLVLVQASDIAWAWAGLVLVGAASGVLLPSLAYWAGRAAGPAAAASQGWRTAFITCGQALGSLAGSYAFSTGASGRWVLVAIVVLLMLASTGAFIIRHRPAALA